MLNQTSLIKGTVVCQVCGHVHSEDEVITVHAYTETSESEHDAQDFTICAECAEDTSKFVRSCVTRRWFYVPLYSMSLTLPIRTRMRLGTFLSFKDANVHSRCELCNLPTKIYNIETVNYYDSQEGYNVSADVCEDCLSEFGELTKCADCGEWFDERDDMYQLPNGEWICEGCYDGHYCTCNDCGDVIRSDDAYHYNGDMYCESCYDSISRDRDDWDEEDDEGHPHVHGYGHKPSNRFRETREDTPGATLYLGTENEWSHEDWDERDDHANYVYHHYAPDGTSGEAFFYMKSDSSLHCGVEVVSHPMSLSYWQGVRPHMDKVLKNSKSYSYDPQDGLHVHLSRNGMSFGHERKFGAFFELLRHQMQLIARRPGNDYCEYLDRETISNALASERPVRAMLAALKSRWHSRYRAVNWNNRRTVEVRIFLTAGNGRDYYAALELCHSAYQWTKRMRFSDMVEMAQHNVLWDAYLNYIADDKRYLDIFDLLYAVRPSNLGYRDHLITDGVEKTEDEYWIEYHKRSHPFQRKADYFYSSKSRKWPGSVPMLSIEDYAGIEGVKRALELMCAGRYQYTNIIGTTIHNGMRYFFIEDTDYIDQDRYLSYLYITEQMLEAPANSIPVVVDCRRYDDDSDEYLPHDKFLTRAMSGDVMWMERTMVPEFASVIVNRYYNETYRRDNYPREEQEWY